MRFTRREVFGATAGALAVGPGSRRCTSQRPCETRHPAALRNLRPGRPEVGDCAPGGCQSRHSGRKFSPEQSSPRPLSRNARAGEGRLPRHRHADRRRRKPSGSRREDQARPGRPGRGDRELPGRHRGARQGRLSAWSATTSWPASAGTGPAPIFRSAAER